MNKNLDNMTLAEIKSYVSELESGNTKDSYKATLMYIFQELNEVIDKQDVCAMRWEVDNSDKLRMYGHGTAPDIKPRRAWSHITISVYS